MGRDGGETKQCTLDELNSHRGDAVYSAPQTGTTSSPSIVKTWDEMKSQHENSTQEKSKQGIN